jgi:hypothetical protein
LGFKHLNLYTVVGDAVAGYRLEGIVKAIYFERSKTESVEFLLKEIKDLLITEELKLKLKNELIPLLCKGAMYLPSALSSP